MSDKEKVYCGNCLHVRYGFDFRGTKIDDSETCCFRKIIIYIDTPIERKILEDDCYEINKNNDCKNYEPKRSYKEK